MDLCSAKVKIMQYFEGLCGTRMKSVLDHPRIKDLHPAGTSCETGPQFLGLTQQTFTFNYQYWTNRDGTPLTTYTGQIGMVQNFVKPIRIQENFVSSKEHCRHSNLEPVL